ncbi:MAG: MarR family transcriptional regulator [Bacteroidetes bacterium]|nr:MarR family transcriptional regulator [Bacteroidota bacterium]
MAGDKNIKLSAKSSPGKAAAVQPVRTIDEEIKQTKPFVSPQQKAVVNLLFTYGWVSERFREMMHPLGLTIQQYNVLRILRGAGGPMSTNAIRDRMLDRMSDTSRLVDRLEKKKLVRKSTCPSDKRLVDVVITKEGQDKLLKMDQQEPGLGTVSQALTDEQAEQLSQLLDSLRSSDPTP